ncbi:peptide-N4-(N-acetyl-beta- glucosaminyl)asparagine amidase, partial [Quaeritorhiza haematococci]
MNPSEADRVAADLGARFLAMRAASSTPTIRPAAPTVKDTPAERQQMLDTLIRQRERVKVYQDFELQDRAREEIPVERLHEEAHRGVERAPSGATDFKEELMKSMLAWFKHEYFTWVNNAPCDQCKSTDTHSTGFGTPTPDEQRHGGNRVELYYCSACNTTNRFPRYNDPIKLMETRRGRCGEWANLFTLFCHTMGYEARYILDLTDHVWTEIYSEREKRWIHCDSCEGEECYDKPLTYEVGWGKKLAYVFAFGNLEIVDVTRRYTLKFDTDVKMRRTAVSDEWLAQTIKRLNDELQAGLHPNTLEELRERTKQEQAELANPIRSGPKAGEMVGRQSGSVEWRSARGELGSSKKGTSGSVNTAIDSSWKKGVQIWGKAAESRVAWDALVASAVESSFSPPADSLKTASAPPSTTTSSNQLTSVPCIQLTPPHSDTKGAAWISLSTARNLTNNIPSSSPSSSHIPENGLVLEFGFRVTNSEGRDADGGADGFAFVLQSESGKAVGEGGCGLGYQGIRKCLAVEFDMYASVDRCRDPSGNHISIHTRGAEPNSAHHNFSVACTPRNTLPRLNDGKIYFVRILLTPPKSTTTGSVNKMDISVFFTDRGVVQSGSAVSGVDFEKVLEAKGVDLSPI